MCSCKNPILNAFIFNGFVEWLKQFQWDREGSAVQLPSKGRNCLLTTPALLSRRRGGTVCPRLCPPLALLPAPTWDPSATRDAQAGCPPPEVESWASSFPVFPLLSAGVMGNKVYKEHFI